MNKFSLLIVEDNEQDLNACRDTVARYQDETHREIDLTECKDVTESLSMLDKTFDGAIIDLRLGNDDDAGNQVIKKIEDEQFRIPIVILTGTPGSADKRSPYIQVLKKGDPGSGYYDLLNGFWKIYDTGLTRILGGRGTIESKLGTVFWQNLLPQIDKWGEYGATDSARTENALLRHTLNHLIQLIDEDMKFYFPEEFYLHPPLSSNIRTGSILNEKESGSQFVVMSPDCDLIIRENGIRNTDKILITKTIPPEELFDWFDSAILGDLSNRKKEDIRRALINNKSSYYHCLPQTNSFPLRFLNFRNISTISEEQRNEKFDTPPLAQISPPFVKDIVARFSSYYARQGQPDIDFGNFTGP